MSNFVPNKVFLRGVLLHYFNMKKKAAESHRILVEMYGEHALAERTCQKWFARFKSGHFDLEDEERVGAPPKFEDAELEELLDQDPAQTQEELAKTLGVDHSTISKRLKANKKTKKMTSKTALAILSQGTEEMEIVITVDVLRRAGIDVVVGGLTALEPTRCSRNVVIVPDKNLQDVAKNEFDIVILPGGLGGSNAMSLSSLVGQILHEQNEKGKLIAAICAAPTALQAHKVGFGKTITSYPGVKEQLEKDYKYVDDLVVQDGQLITSRGPGTAFQFALKIVENLVGIEKAKEIAKGLLLEY